MVQGNTGTFSQRTVRVEIVCSDPTVAFAGDWPRAEAAAQIVARYRERARALGVPIQVAVERAGVWSIAPNGKVVRGSLFDLEKLQPKKKRSTEPKKKRTTARPFDRLAVHGKKANPKP